MRIFETHAHLDFPDFNRDRDDVIRQCLEQGIGPIINIGLDEASSRASIALAEKYDSIYATVGFHPHDARKFDLGLIRELIQHRKVVAIGEIGLDYYRDLSPRQVQQQVFRAQLELAVDKSMPVVIHNRDAHQDCWQILDEYNPARVVFHCYSGNIILAEKIIARGWNISFTGTVTYRNSISRDVVRTLPLEKIFIETDSPFLSPVPLRGRRNNPLNLRYIIEEIAVLKETTPVKVAETTWCNATRFFLPEAAG